MSTSRTLPTTLLKMRHVNKIVTLLFLIPLSNCNTESTVIANSIYNYPKEMEDLQIFKHITTLKYNGLSDISRIHFLGKFSSYKQNDQLTQYLLFLKDVTRLIYSYDIFMRSYNSAQCRFGTCNSHMNYYCRFNTNTCEFIQVVFGQGNEMAGRWEMNMITKLHYAPQVPYHLLYVSPYSQEEVKTGMEISF